MPTIAAEDRKTVITGVPMTPNMDLTIRRLAAERRLTRAAFMRQVIEDAVKQLTTATAA
ncbi:hypothetical protein [Streptomyces anandii]|uniref:hypothetical protein n=1 Tax=Streptomyces anandii TaxID=285454 RepID=UPI000AF6A68E|nr:hypothetical protein [Streptomyces anandii]GGX94608.1 hypothetical protein GCM10010510_44760 [Streptomyces anandii JCM 4720]